MRNPLELDIKGNIQVQGICIPSSFPLLNGKLTKNNMNFKVGFDFNIEQHTMEYGIKTPHMVLKFDSSPESMHLKSIQLYTFETLLDNTKSKDIHLKISGEAAEYAYTQKSTIDREYKLTLEQINITKHDTKSKWEGSITIPHWTLKLDIKNQPSLQKYWAAVLADGMALSRQKNVAVSKLSAAKQVAISILTFLKSLHILEPYSSLEVESKIKRGEEILDFKATIFKEDKNPKLKIPGTPGF
jgi:hypothetical protein